MIQTFDLSRKVILITGGYGYLGKAITESLLFHGASVYVLGRNIDKFRQAFLQCSDYKDRLFFQFCDVTNSESISDAFQSIFLETGHIDVLINNAFLIKGQSPEKMSDEDWLTGIDGTLGSVFKCIREIIPYFIRSKSGKIINVASMYGVIAPDFEAYNNHPEFLNPPHYGAAKGGIIQLTKYYAAYLGKLGITANAISPGAFPSRTVQEEGKFIEELKKRTCLNRIGYPDDLAGAFVFLSSDTSNYITGQNIIVDGGWTVK